MDLLENTFHVPSGLPDVSGIKTLFLTSGNFGHYSSLGPRGETDIIRRIDVSAPHGSYITDRLGLVGEYIECGNQQLQTLRFRLTDSYGQVVDLQGRSFSFSIIFLRQ